MSKGKVTMDHHYAREKLTTLVRDLDQYTAEEFWRQMSRIAAGATGTDHAEEIAKERDALAAHVERMSKVALDAIHYMPGGEIKAELRDAYDATPETSLARFKAQWQTEALDALEALVAIHEYCDETGYVDGEGFVDVEAAVEKARAALAKARGEQS